MPATYIYIYIYVLSATVPLVHCWCVWALSYNLFHQCSILILILMLLGVVACASRGPTPPYSYYSQRLAPHILQPFFDAAFWAPLSPKGCPKMSIVRIWGPKTLHFGSHFGAQNGAKARTADPHET